MELLIRILIVLLGYMGWNKKMQLKSEGKTNELE